MKVRDVMTSTVFVVRPGTPLKQVAALLVEKRISGVPVVDEDGSVLGVVSEADFLSKEAVGRSAPAQRSWFEVLIGGRDLKRAELDRIAARSASEAMTEPAKTIGPDETLHRAAQLMVQGSINRLPVVDDGRLVGIISRADIVRVFARTDEEIRDLVAFALRAVDGLMVADVEDGVVRLSGTVASEPLALTIRSIVQQLDGVVAVDDRDLTWREQPEPVLR
jgi:CBS domain-containing protein